MRNKSNGKFNKLKKINYDAFVPPQSNASKLKKWLENNSISALNLTIFNVLLDNDNDTDAINDIYETKVWKDVSFQRNERDLSFNCVFIMP